MAKISIPDPRAKPLRPPKPLPEPAPSRPPWRVAGVFFVIAVVVVTVKTFRSEPPPPAAAPPDATASAAPSASASAAPAAPPRCVAAAEGFVVGDLPKPKPQVDGGDDEPTEDLNSPFAVEMGKGAAFDGGFAIGALRDAEGGAVAMLATVGVDGKGGKLVRLARTRGDLDPPVVAGAGASVVAAMVQANASARSVKIAKIAGEEITWGPEFKEGRDESTALDVAVAGARAVVAWDDLVTDGGRSAVFAATLDAATLSVIAQPRAVSGEKIEADSPRVVARPGGFWLAWIARAEVTDKKKPKTHDDDNTDEVDTDTPAGEAIEHRWVEVAPLDEAGTPTGQPRGATPRTGNVLAFDMKPGADGGAVVAYRDDDTPAGSTGGKISTAWVKVDGSVEAHVVEDDNAGAGAPTLQPGWLSISGLAGRAYLAAIGERGDPLEALEVEPAFGNGEVIAASKGTLLLARPEGRAVRLTPVTCTPRPVAKK